MKAQGFLAQALARVVEQVDSRKVKYKGQDALKALAGVDQLWVAKGKRMTYVDLKRERPSDEDLVALLTGPTGNLRAPAIRRGRKLFVGFHPEGYRENLLA